MSTSLEELARQLAEHAANWRAGGVDWLVPGATPLGTATPTPTGQRNQTTPSMSLFPTTVPTPTQASPPELDTRTKITALRQVEEEVRECFRCEQLASRRTQTVFGVGRPDAELMFVGEAPGFEEDRQGEPFVGAAGQLLDRILAACKLSRSEVYIANILKCRPPNNRAPLLDEAAHCLGYLARQIDIIRPKFICCLGAVAVQHLLKTTASISRLRGRFLDYRGIPVMPTYHPAYLLRNPAAKREVWEDMKLLMAAMGRPVG